jgi:hypothetical protein
MRQLPGLTATPRCAPLLENSLRGSERFELPDQILTDPRAQRLLV